MKLPCNLSSHLWTGCYLTHCTIKLCACSSIVPTNGSGRVEIRHILALKLQKSFMRKWPKYPHSLFQLHYLLAPSTCLWPCAEFHMISWQREDWGLIYRWICIIYPQNREVYCYNTTFWDIPKGKLVKKNLPLKFWRTELQAVYLVVHFPWKKWPTHDCMLINGS